MSNRGSFVVGMLLGAGVMYLLDPDRGRRRRARIRDQVVHRAHALEDLGGGTVQRARDLRNRARGAVHEARARLRPEVVDDPVLEERVRSELGRLTSSPGLIEVAADHGRVVLRGQVLARELDGVVRGVERVRGVRELVNRLQIRTQPSGAPGARESSR